MAKNRDPQPSYQVLTLNAWGLWLVSRDRHVRMQHLADYIRGATELDVVLLQEVWVDSDAQLLLEAGRQGCLPHGMHFRSGIFGSGLVTLSRHPIVAAGFHRYSASGDAMAVHCGDFFAGKGVGWVRVCMPHGAVDVYNTHVHANYSHKVLSRELRLAGAGAGGAERRISVPQDRFAPYRVSHVLELAQLVQFVSGSGRSVGLILGGDLNTKPFFLEMALLRCLLPELVDSWTHVHGVATEGPKAGHTCRAAECTYRSTRQIPERIDYVLAAGFAPTAAHVTLQRTSVGCSYSDHLAVQVELRPLATSDNGMPTRSPLPRHVYDSLEGVSTGRYPWPVPSECEDGTSGKPASRGKTEAGDAQQASSEFSEALVQVVGCCMLLLTKGVAINSRHARERLLWAAVCIASALLLVAATAWSGRRACCDQKGQHGAQETFNLFFSPNPLHSPGLCMLVAAVLSAVGMLLGLMGGVADHNQARALQQSISHLQLLGKTAEQHLRAHQKEQKHAN